MNRNQRRQRDPGIASVAVQPKREDSTGVVVSVHPIWPDIQFTPGELFFECTLFLYSVLALFLQYLNIYKTLWWLPKSYWHYSMKFHLINPYFLSCVGLLLGWRVTRCFWKTITEIIADISNDRSQFVQSALTVFEYAIVKTPLMTLIISSFLFSFFRVCHDYSFNTVVCILCPLVVYVFLFYAEILDKMCRIRDDIYLLCRQDMELSDFFERLCLPPPAEIDLDSVHHMCSANPGHIREEVNLFVSDLWLRIKRSLYAGLSTAFLSVALPCFFVPFKTSLGMSLRILIDEAWEWELGIVVCLTAMSLYATYLLPVNYLDMLHRSAVHLGSWEPIEGPKIGITGAANWAPLPWTENVLYNEKESVQLPDGRCFRASAALSSKLKTIAAEPGNQMHYMFYLWCSQPCRLINYMCIFEGALIVIQFWMLVLTTDWQHIVTLVLLMFANYLLLAKLFKDKVILGRIYEPSPEDIALIQQLKAENRAQ